MPLCNRAPTLKVCSQAWVGGMSSKRNVLWGVASRSSGGEGKLWPSCAVPTWALREGRAPRLLSGGAGFLAATESERYQEYYDQNVHVVPQFSGDEDANTGRFHTLLDTMKSALTEAGLI